MIPFNKPSLTGNEIKYIYQAIYSGKISGNGIFTQKCQKYFEERYKIKKTLLTTSCTDALEMCAILANIKNGDEVIIPTYTFVSTALAFVRQGAKIIFADSRYDYPGIDENRIENLITNKTKAIIPMHYAGISCDMDKIIKVAKKYNLLIIEDAAQGIESKYKDRPLGSIGNLATFSFHETKNINSGEGGLLAINDDKFIHRSEIIWEKGTNRAEYFRGEVNKYGWIDIGSSFLPSEITAAYLWAQLEKLDEIQKKRKNIWEKYYNELEDWAQKKEVRLPIIPEYATNNGHIFYIIVSNLKQRTKMIKHLKDNNIMATFHYLCLHKSKFYLKTNDRKVLKNAEYFEDRLIRLPVYYELTNNQVEYIIRVIKNYKF